MVQSEHAESNGNSNGPHSILKIKSWHFISAWPLFLSRSRTSAVQYGLLIQQKSLMSQPWHIESNVQEWILYLENTSMHPSYTCGIEI